MLIFYHHPGPLTAHDPPATQANGLHKQKRAVAAEPPMKVQCLDTHPGLWGLYHPCDNQ